MSDPRDLLDGWQRLADEATPGPWELGEGWSYITPDTATGHHATDCPACGHGVRVELSAEDAGFILAARTIVPALVAAVRAVLDVRYDDCPLGSTEGHEGWCDALDAARKAITDALNTSTREA